MDYQKTAAEILRLVGGKDNVATVTHCMTRLRFTLKDRKLAQVEELKKLSGETGYSVNALCILYLTSQPFEVYPILGYSRLEQLLSAKEAADGKLTREQVLRLKPEWVW